MAEVLGVISSMIAIIDGIEEARAIFKQHVHSSSSVKAELVPLLAKLTAFAGILRGIQLQCDLEDADSTRLEALSHLWHPLKSCQDAIRLISTRLEKLRSARKHSLTFGKIVNKETAAALSILDQSRQVLDLSLTADQRTLTQSIEAYVRNIAQDVRDARLECASQLEQVHQGLGQISDQRSRDAESENKIAILDWISNVDCKHNLVKAASKVQRSDGSGEWFIQGKAFRSWSLGQGDTRLLVTGMSGSGKSVLCSKAIEYAYQQQVIGGCDLNILYFFFDFSDATKETVNGMIRSLLRQLIAKMDQVPDNVHAAYTKCQGSPGAVSMPDRQEWCELLCSALSALDQAHIFIDALDECADMEVEVLRSTLDTMLSKVPRHVRWLFTCRPNTRTIEELLQAGFQHVTVTTEQVDKDINNHLSMAFLTDVKLSRFTEEARQCIISEISSNSAGSFRYARCQLDSVYKIRDRRTKNVKQILRQMPRDIFSSYQRVLGQARLLDDWHILRRVLMIVSFSARPVSLDEAAEFAVLEEDMSSIGIEDRLDLTDSLSSIDTLIFVSDGELSLAHKSVQDFFVDTAESDTLQMFQHADLVIGKRCLQYLSFAQLPVRNVLEATTIKEPNSTHLRHLLAKHPFLSYAATHWAYHLRDKHRQQEAYIEMQAALPLTRGPNLWKAWLLLQRADIWDSQIQLAHILCEAQIRASLLPGWSDRFWSLRKDYRVVNKDTSTKTVVSSQGDDSLRAVLAKRTALFWAVAVRDQIFGHEEYLQFTKGQRIWISSVQEEGKKWIGSIGNEDKATTGWILPSNVAREPLNAMVVKAGKPYYDLALLLLEVAFQTAIFEHYDIEWRQSSSSLAFEANLAQLRRLTKRTTAKMGYRYGQIVSACLGHVKWLEGTSDVPEMSDHQDEAITEVLQPLGEMLASGFRVSRRVPKRTEGNLLGSAAGDGVWAKHRSSRWHSTGYVDTRSYKPSEHHAASTAGALRPQRLWALSETPYLPLGHGSESESTTNEFVKSTRIHNLVRVSREEPQAATPSSDFTPAQQHFAMSPLERHGILKKSADSMTIDERQGGKKASDLLNDLPKATTSAILSTDTTYSEGTLLSSDTDQTDGTRRASLLSSHAEQIGNIKWEYPDKLIIDMPSTSDQPTEYAPPSDYEKEAMLVAVQYRVLASGDARMQLIWSRDVIDHIEVAENNRQRSLKAVGSQSQPGSDEIQIGAVAAEIINTLLLDGHPDAISIQHNYPGWAKYLKSDVCGQQTAKTSTWFSRGYQEEREGDHSDALKCYREGAEQGDSSCCYRMGMILLRGELGQAFDTEQGIMFLERATNGGFVKEATDAKYVMGLLHARCGEAIGLPADILPLHLLEARKWLTQSANEGHAGAQFFVGAAYEEGNLLFSKNTNLAFHFYTLSARRGHPLAEMAISKMITAYGCILGQETVLEIAFTFAKRAAECNKLPQAQLAVAQFLQKGSALSLMENLAAHGVPETLDALECSREVVRSQGVTQWVPFGKDSPESWTTRQSSLSYVMGDKNKTVTDTSDKISKPANNFEDHAHDLQETRNYALRYLF